MSDLIMDRESFPVFKTCGISISLSGADLPESVRIFHPLREELCGYAKLRREGNQFDIEIIMGEKRLKLHKNLLIDRIPFFSSIFTSNMIEHESREINLSTVSCGKVRYRYCREHSELCLHGTSEYLGEHCSEFNDGSYLLSALDECAVFLKRRINIDNALPMLLFCRSIKYKKIEDVVLRFIDKNFVPISLTRNFFELSIEALVSILQRDSLNVDNEIRVFEAVVRWVRNRTDRKQHSLGLLICVRCTLLPENNISDFIQKTDWVMENPDCMTHVEKAKAFNQTKEQEYLLSGAKISTRVCDDAHNLIFAIGYKSMQIYDPSTNKWTKSTSAKKLRTLNTATVADQKIYRINGLTSHTDDCEFLDTATNEWKLVPGNYNKRKQGATAVINGIIYVIGGVLPNSSIIQTSMEAYNPVSQEWKSLAPMRENRVCPAVCVLNGKLYVFGGHGNTGDLSDGECYDPENNRWDSIRSMNHKRCAFSAAAFNGQIYVVGGYDGSDILQDVDRYDPVTDSWTSLKNMNYGRALASLVVSCGKIFAVGGLSQVKPSHILHNALPSVEMYHPETDSWEMRTPMDESSLEVGALIIPVSLPSPIANLEGNFFHFLLKPELVRAVDDCKFLHPTEVQHCCLFPANLGENVICQSSGLGKSTSYVISTLHQLNPIDGEVSILVICPTRELAAQIGKEYERFSKYLSEIKIHVYCDDVPNKKKRKGKCCEKPIIPHIVIGTPALIHSQVKSGQLKLDRIKQLVIDKCDRITGDFKQRTLVNAICKSTPQKKQIMMFSSVLHLNLGRSCQKFIRNGYFE
uniref:RNA helicase n=1 Tax=Pristionchus pacificus TaxID=54126 RepID=A0A2A6BF45_PRIPA|eukprot:PDM64504.1 BTB And C-terminal Kelch domain containing protein [Pristionchus pacificus]